MFQTFCYASKLKSCFYIPEYLILFEEDKLKNVGVQVKSKFQC